MSNNSQAGKTAVLTPDPEVEFEPLKSATDDDHESDSNVSGAEHDDEVATSAPSIGEEAAAHVPTGEDGLELADARVEANVAFEPEVDAELAEFATDEDIERALASISEVVIGPDDRVQVTATNRYPWRAICSLRIRAANGRGFIGTGFLVSPRVLITAGHVVFMHNQGGWADEIEVIPGRNGARQPFGSCTSKHFHSVTGWTKKGDRNYDYGAIVLPNDCRFGDRVGWFGYANYSDATLSGLKVNLSGYPGDKGGATQWWHARRLTNLSSRMLRYNIDTAGGQSGSPVWRLRNGQRYAVGVHTTGSQSGNGATRINGPVYNRITSWTALHK